MLSQDRRKHVEALMTDLRRIPGPNRVEPEAEERSSDAERRKTTRVAKQGGRGHKAECRHIYLSVAFVLFVVIATFHWGSISYVRTLTSAQGDEGLQGVDDTAKCDCSREQRRE